MKEKELSLVNKFDLVFERLRENFRIEMAFILLGFWAQLATRGEEYVKKIHSRSSYYRKMKFLRELQISWENTDLYLDKSRDVLANFYPSHNSDRLVDEHGEFVKESMLKFLKEKS